MAPQSLNHFNRLRAVKVTGTLAPGYAIDEALQGDGRRGEARRCRSTAQTDLDGQSREFRDSGREIYFTFVLALLFIYLVLVGAVRELRRIRSSSCCRCRCR